MQPYSAGDRIQVDIPDKRDPDHRRLHRESGIVVEVLTDDAVVETGDDRDAVIYRVELDDGERVDLRWRDVRPARKD